MLVKNLIKRENRKNIHYETKKIRQPWLMLIVKVITSNMWIHSKNMVVNICDVSEGKKQNSETNILELRLFQLQINY